MNNRIVRSNNEIIIVAIGAIKKMVIISIVETTISVHIESNVTNSKNVLEVSELIILMLSPEFIVRK